MKRHKIVITLIVLTFITHLLAFIANFANGPIVEAFSLGVDWCYIINTATSVTSLISNLLLLLAYAMAILGLAQGEKGKAPLAILATSCLLGVVLNLGYAVYWIWVLATDNSPIVWHNIAGVIGFITTITMSAGLIWLAVVVHSTALRITSIIFAISQITLTLFKLFASPYIWEYIAESTNRTLFTSLYQGITFVCDFGPELLFFAAFIHFAQSLKVRN